MAPHRMPLQCVQEQLDGGKRRKFIDCAAGMPGQEPSTREGVLAPS